MLGPQPQRLFPESEYLWFLLRTSEILGQSLDYHETLQNVATAAVSTIADLCIIDIGDVGDTQMVGAAHREAPNTAEFNGVSLHLESERDRPIHPVCQVLKTGKTFYAPHIDDRWIDEHASRPEHAAFMRRMQYTSMIVVPMVSQVFGLSGTLTLVTVQSGHAPFHEPAVNFAEGLGRMCASAIGKARLYDETHAAATMFQRAALPRTLPQVSGLQFFPYYQPASRTRVVGGDWYDAFLMPDGRIGISLGDVAGHGLHASAVMGSIRNALRTALISQSDIGRALDTVDYLLRNEYPDVPFCTAMLAIIDVDSMTLRLGSAGHPGPRIWDEASKTVIDPFVDRDLPLGLRELSARTQPRTIRLEGGLVVFYTDGLVECKRDLTDGERKLNEVIARPEIRNAADPAQAIREALVDCENYPDDDIAILVVRFTPQSIV